MPVRNHYVGRIIPDIPFVWTGLIFPFNDIAANIPADWEQWTAGGDRALRHVNSGAGGTGGSTGVSRSTGSSGTHSGSGFTGWGGSSSGSDNDRTSANAGNHSHSFTITYYPARRKQIMMKSTKDQLVLPRNTGILSDVDIPGLTNITTEGYMLYGADGTTSSNSGNSASNGNTNSAGTHDHLSGTGVAQNSGTAYAYEYGKGNHSHTTSSASVIDNLYKYYMGLWTDAAAQMALTPGMYAIWEDDTPPIGWAICDGTLGTPDLSGYMVFFDTTKLGTKSGNGTITTNSTVNSGGSHEHRGGSGSRGSRATFYHSNNISHSHSLSSASSSFNPQYKNVIFVKFIGA